MTPEDVKKAVAEAAAPLLGPLYERLGALEETVAKAEDDTDPTVVEKAEAEAPEEVTLEGVQRIVAETVTEAISPITKRLEAVESASGQRQSGLEEQGAHSVQKKADGSFSWEGSGLLL